MTDSLQRMQQLAPGFYTERDSGDWYIISPGGDRVGEDFNSREEARQLVCALAGDDLPKGWRIGSENPLATDLEGPKWHRATLWTRPCERYFPGALARFPRRK